MLLLIGFFCIQDGYAQNLFDNTEVLEFYLEFDQANWKKLLEKNIPTEEDIPAALIVNETRYDSIGVRYKGNSSLRVSSDKKPFNLSMDIYVDGQNLQGFDTLNLNNCFKDPTFVREIIAYEIADRYLPAAKTVFTKLFINNEYWGLYLMVEQLDRNFLRTSFGTDTGNHYKSERGSLTWERQETELYKKDYELKTNEAEDDWSDLIELIDKLNHLSGEEFTEEIYKVLDVDRALWYIAFCNLLVNLDSYIGSGHNFYLYHNPPDDRFHIIPQDLNEVLGVFSEKMSIPQLERLPIYYNINLPGRPLISKLLQVNEFRERYIAHFRTMFEEVWNISYWEPRITFYQDLIRSDVEADTKKLYSMNLFYENVVSNISATPGLLSFIQNRGAYLANIPELNRELATISVPVLGSNVITSKNEVTIDVNVERAVSVALWYSKNGKAFQNMKMIKESGSTFRADIPRQEPGTEVRYYIEAQADNGAYSYNPAHAEKEYYAYRVEFGMEGSAVVINELMASNDKTLPDIQGDYDDWIELHNVSNATVDLSGKFLTDDYEEPKKWKFPGGTIIEPHDYLLVWADNDTGDSPGLHTSFKLSKSGEEVFLFDSDENGNELMDGTTFGSQITDVSWGCLPDGKKPFQLLSAPSPNTSNETGTGIDSGSHLTMSGYKLYQNFPNPFNPTTTIRYKVPAESNVELIVYDILGRKVAVLVNEVVQAGVHEAVWDAKDKNGNPVGSGVYIYKFFAGEYTNHGKVLLLR